MCGRFTMTTPADAMRNLFKLDRGFERNLAPRYNIAPTTPIEIVRTAGDGAREMAPVLWGLVPAWAKDTAIGVKMINARSETAAEKPAFKTALRRRRCLVPTNGFYEWQKVAGLAHKQPYWIGRAPTEDDAHPPFAFAGLWEAWSGPNGEAVETAAILTTAANAALAPLHHRMPVVLDPADWDRWLTPNEAAPPTDLLRSAPDAALISYPVDVRVGNVKHDDPDLCVRAAPAAPAPPAQGALF